MSHDDDLASTAGLFRTTFDLADALAARLTKEDTERAMARIQAIVIEHDDSHLMLGACVCMCAGCLKHGRCICTECAHNESSIHDDEEPDIQLNQDHHSCLECSVHVTSVSVKGVNTPCGHRAGTLVTLKTDDE